MKLAEHSVREQAGLSESGLWEPSQLSDLSGEEKLDAVTKYLKWRDSDFVGTSADIDFKARIHHRII